MRVGLLIMALLLAACETAPPAPGVDAGVRGDTDAGPFDAGSLPDGGPMGSDAGIGAVDAGHDAATTTGGTCPPSSPYGTGVGEVAQDLVLMDCDGVEHTLHELCDRQAVWLFEFADWCPPCRDFASRDANRIYERFAGPDFGAYMVISEDSGFGQPNAADCATIRDRYGITMPILYDPGTAFEDTFDVASNEVQIVLRRGAVLEWKGHYQASQVETRIESALAP